MSDYADNLRNSLGMDRDLSVPAGRYEEQKAAEEARLAEEKAREERAAAAGDRYYQGFLERRGFAPPEEGGQAGAPAAVPQAFDAEGFLSRANLTRDDIYAPLYDGAPSGVYKPAAYSALFREMIKASDQPLEMENRLNSAYYLAMMEGIPFDEAFNNFEAISTAYYGSALSPKSWHKAVQTTWQAATISTEISKLAYKLGQKGGADQELMNRIRELESYIPQADEIKRNLPTEALKAAAQFIPSQLESVVAGVTGGAIGGALAVATGGFGTVAIPTIAMFGYRMGGAIGAGLKTHELETGALYYDLLKYEERSVGEDGQEKVERVNPEVAWHVAQIYGLVAAATELLPMDHFLKGLGGAVGLGKAVEKTSSVASAATRAGKVRDIFLKFLGKQKSALAEGIMDVGLETVQEVVQETANIVAAEYAKEITNSEWGTSLDPITREEAQARIQETLVQSFMGMGVLSGVKGGIKLMVSGAKTAKTAADASKTMKAEEKAMDGYELKPEDMELYRKRADEALPANVRIARSTILEGSEYAMHAVDSTTGKSMATLRYEFEAGKGEAPGTVRVLGLKSGAAPRVNAELMTALMRQFPGWDVEFNPQNANQAALKALLVERNPRGAAAGMQWYYAEKGLPDANTLKYMDERLRDVAPGWNDADRLAAVNTVSLWASKMGMTGDQLADAIFAPGVFTPQTNRILTADKIAQGAAGATSWQGVGKAFKALIDIAPNANPSTMLHESSHAVVNFMLEVRRGAIKVAQKDQVLGLLSDMEKALGVENGNWDAQFTGWTEEAVQGNRSYWEAITYAMEDYLAFGKAPKPELKGLFARFAKWIMDIYQGLKAARVQMSPELSAFFDRLFDDADSVFGEEAQTISEADLATTAEPDDIAGEPPLEIYQGERANRQQQRSQRAGLAEAKRMEAAGRTMDEIAAATGWQKVDGDWRARKDRRWGEALSPEAQEAMEETARRPRQVNGAADKAFPLYQGGWTYKADEAIQKKPWGKMPGRQVLAMLRGFGVKQDELEWTGLEKFLDTDEKVTPAQVQEILNANRLEIEEREYSERVPFRPGKYGKYALPGGENYREVLFKLPDVAPKLWEEANRIDGQIMQAPVGSEERYALIEKADEISKQISQANLNAYRSSHWAEPNVLAHTRLKDRTDSLGRKLLFVEEIQSDWHQAGRDNGYRLPSETTTPMDAEYRALVHKNQDAVEQGRDPDPADVVRAQQLEAALIQSDKSNIPDAPLKKTWHEFVFKRILREAAENFYDAVAWTTGEQQAERYGLANQVEQIRYIKKGETWDVWASDSEGRALGNAVDKQGLNAQEVAGFVGKDLAKRIVAGEGRNEDGDMVLDGLDLKMGGDGMRSFYDRDLVSYANKLAKKYGVQVESLKVPGDEKAPWGLIDAGTGVSDGQVSNPKRFPTREAAQAYIDQFNVSYVEPALVYGSYEAHAIQMTPEMRADIMTRGLPLFQGEKRAPTLERKNLDQFGQTLYMADGWQNWDRELFSKLKEELTREELEQVLTLNEVSGIAGRRAYREDLVRFGGPLPVQASLDADSLKWVNDNLGHEAGDEMLRRVAWALDSAAKKHGVYAYHFSGDEYAVQGETVEAVIDAINEADDILAQVTLEAPITGGDGARAIARGLRVSAGLDGEGDLHAADRRLAIEKSRKEKAGERAGRGEIPVQIEIRDAAGGILDGDRAREYIRAAERARQEAAQGASRPADDQYDPERIRHLRESRRAETRRPTQPLYSIVTHHGAKAGFSRFSLSYMGTGEGQQVYGWGLYFTENRGVAKGQYAERLGSRPTLTVPPKREEDSPYVFRAAREAGLLLEDDMVRELRVEITERGAGFDLASPEARQLFKDTFVRLAEKEIRAQKHSDALDQTKKAPAMETALKRIMEDYDWDQASIEGGRWLYEVEIQPKGKREGKAGTPAGAGWDAPISQKQLNRLGSVTAGWDEYGVIEFEKEYGYTPNDTIIEGAEDLDMTVGAFIAGLVDGAISGEDGDIDTGADLWAGLMRHINDVDFVKKLLEEADLTDIYPGEGATATVMTPEMIKQGQADLGTHIGDYTADDIADFYADFAEDGETTEPKYVQTILDAVVYEITKRQAEIPTVTAEAIEAWLEINGYFNPESQPPEVKAHTEALTMIAMEVLDRFEEGHDKKRSHAAIATRLYFAGPDDQPVLFIRPNENTPRAVEAEEGRWLRWERPAPREDMDAVRATLKALQEGGNDPIRATFELGERDDASPMRGRIQVALNRIPDGANLMGEALYNVLRSALGGKKEASLLLKAAGFDGVKYPVGFLSGNLGDKGFNYVVFDEEALQVRNRILFQGDFGKQIDVPQGSVTTAILALQNAKAGIVEAAATRAPIGDIAIPWGWEGNESKGFNDGVGLAKIIRKHEQRDQVLVNLGSILKEGAIYQDPVFNERVWFIWGQYRAVVSTYRGKGADRRWGPWLMTAYIPEASRSSGKPIIPTGAVLIEPGTEPETPKKTVIKIKRRKTLLQGEGAKRIEQLKPAIARAAQDIYDAWDQDEEGVDEAYGTGGICDEIASQIGSLLIEDGWEIVDGGWDGDDHAFVIAVSETEAYAVDIPPQVYETGGGYSWSKKPGVTFSPDDIVVYEVDRENVIDENETLYQAEAYHGTPWDFDEFDTGKIGTGEGAQAFGWGLYFTNNEEIAKGYAQKLTRKQLADGDFIEKIDGVPVAEWGKGVQFAMESARMGGATRVNEILHVFKLVINSGRFKGEELEAIKRAREAIAAGNAELGLVEGRRRLYNVTLWEGKDAVLLDWNRPLYEQDDKVIEALARSGIKLPTMEEVQDAHTEAENNLLKDLLDDIDSPTDPEIDVQWNEEAQAWDYFFDGQYAGWSDTEDGAWDAAEEEAADAGMQRRAEIETKARDQLSEDDVREEAMAILGEKGYSTDYAMTWGDYWHALREAGGPFYTHEDKVAHSREISMGLLNAGIDGVRFPAASNGMGTGSAGWNYVVFDDAEVTIKRKVIYQGERARQSNALLQGGEEPDNGASQLYGLVREMSAEGKGWEEFAEYVEGTKDWLPNSASAPDLPPDQKLGWYKTVWDEAMLDARRGTDLNKWMKDLADNKHAGLKGFLRAIWTNVLLREREEPPYGTTAADAAAWVQEQQRAGAIRQLLAEPIIAGAISLGAKSDTLSNQYLASVMGIIRANPEEYASIYGEVTGDEKIGKLGAQAAMAKYEDIKDPRMKQRMSISERAALAAQIRDKELEKDVLAGRVTDDRVKEYIDKLKKNAQADRRRLEKLAAEIKAAEAAVDARGREIADARVKLTQANAEARRIAARVKAYLDKNATIPAALETQKAQIEKQREATRQRLVNALDWMEIEKELEKQKAVVNRALLAQDEYRAKGKDTPATVLKRKSEALARIRELEPKLAMAKEYKNSAQLQTYLAKLETETKIKDRMKVRDAERRAAQKLRSYREGLAKRIMKTAGDGIHVSYQKDIRKIQAAINPENPSAKTMESINLLRAELEKNPELASEVPKKWLQRAIGKNLNEMTLEELESTERRVRELRDAGREKQRRIEEQRAEQAEEYRARIADILMTLPGYKEPRGYEGEKSWEDKLLLKFQEFNYGWMNAQRFAERMDGGTQGQNYELLILERDRHYRVARENIARRRQAIMDGLKELGIDPAEWYNTEVTILGAGPGRTNKTLRKSDLLAIEMAFRNEDSRQAVLFGDFFSAKEKQAMDEDEIMMEGAHRFGIIRAAIDANLTAKDREALEKVFRKDAAEAGPRLAETVAEAENREMAEVDDYFPIRREGVTGDPIDVQLAGEMLNRTSGLRRPPKNGFTKSRVKISPAHQSPVKLDLLSTWLESIEHQEHYMATVMYGKRLDAFYLSPFVQEQVRGAFGDAGIEYLKEYITEIKNPGSQRHHNRWENSIRWLRGNLGVAYLAFRASSVLKQLVTSPWPALPYAGPRLFTEAMKMMVNPVGYVRDTEAMSTVLANRTQDMVFEAIRANAKARGLGKAMNVVNEYGMKGLELVDRLCVAVGWRAMYEAELAKNGGDHQKALERADDLTLRTQPSSRGVDLAPIYRKAGEGTRLLLQFTQALNVVYQNIRYDLPLAVRNHQWGTAIGTIVGYMIAGVLLNAVVAGPDEDEENRYLFWAFTQATESIPLIGMEATRIMKRAITGAKEPMMPDTALPGIGNILDGMYRLTGGEIEKGLIEFATGGGMILGLPVNGIREAYRATTGDHGALMGKPKKE